MVVSCTTSDKASTTWDFDYAYQIKTYDHDTLDRNLRHIEYYDEAGRLVRAMGSDEGCKRFIYDSQGHLVETVWGRTCDIGTRELMIYDSSYNLLGTYITRDSLVNLDTAKFKQRLFYDAENNLIKELEHEWNSSDGEHFEQWHSYVYENGRKVTDTIKQNDRIEWTGTYSYDSNNNLTSIHRMRNSTFEIETFKYDSARRIIEREIKSNEYPLTPDVSFSAGNHKTFYRYDKDGQLTERKIVSHKGKVQIKTIYLRTGKH